MLIYLFYHGWWIICTDSNNDTYLIDFIYFDYGTSLVATRVSLRINIAPDPTSRFSLVRVYPKLTIFLYCVLNTLGVWYVYYGICEFFFKTRIIRIRVREVLSDSHKMAGRYINILIIIWMILFIFLLCWPYEKRRFKDRLLIP